MKKKMITLWTLLVFSLAIQILMFLPAYLNKTDKLTDATYGLTFILLTFVAFVSQSITTLKMIVFLMILLWALRLTIYLSIRISKIKKDERFEEIRNHPWKFLGFWIAQGLLVWIILLPALMFFLMPGVHQENPLLMGAGFLLWFIGLSIETVADYQKFTFKNKAKNKKEFMAAGIWKYSRHPNYLGEILLWIGIYAFAAGALSPIQMLIGLLGPLTIFIFLRYVSGIPPLEARHEEKYGKRKDYKEYVKKTPLLFPKLFPKK